MNLKTARTLASAAAMFAMASAATVSIAHAQDNSSAAKVQCFGVNSCKGQSDCKSGAHDCKGQNDCKGQGFKAESAKACSAQHGSTTPPAHEYAGGGSASQRRAIRGSVPNLGAGSRPFLKSMIGHVL